MRTLAIFDIIVPRKIMYSGCISGNSTSLKRVAINRKPLFTEGYGYQMVTKLRSLRREERKEGVLMQEPS